MNHQSIAARESVRCGQTYDGGADRGWARDEKNTARPPCRAAPISGVRTWYWSGFQGLGRRVDGRRLNRHPAPVNRSGRRDPTILQLVACYSSRDKADNCPPDTSRAYRGFSNSHQCIQLQLRPLTATAPTHTSRAGLPVNHPPHRPQWPKSCDLHRPPTAAPLLLLPRARSLPPHQSRSHVSPGTSLPAAPLFRASLLFPVDPAMWNSISADKAQSSLEDTLYRRAPLRKRRPCTLNPPCRFSVC
jgi:hypothetical protein